MPTPRKIETVAALRDRIQRASISLSIDYRGLRVRDMEQLRRRLRAAEGEIKVVKNTLLALAAKEAGQPDLTRIVQGPTALAFGYADPMEAAKTLTEYAQSVPDQFTILGAFLDGQALNADELKDLVKLPPRPVLLSQIAGQLQSPAATLVALLDAPLQKLSLLLQSALDQLPGLIEARARQLEASEQA